MQARAAYIRSIGTTGILVAAALLMLATVSALVAYEGWPGSVGSDSVTSVPVETPRDVSVVRSATEVPVAAVTRVAARASAAAAATTSGVVRDVTARGPSTVGLVKVQASPAPAAPDPVAATPAPAPGPPASPVGSPAAPAPPSVAIPEPLPAPVDGTEEVAFGVLGTALPVGEDSSDGPATGLGAALDDLVRTLP